MKAHFFDPKESISIIWFLDILKFVGDTNCINKKAEIRVIPRYVNEVFANALNSRVCTSNKSSPIAASVGNLDDRLRQLLRSYPEIVKHMIKHFATDKAIPESDAAILW